MRTYYSDLKGKMKIKFGLRHFLNDFFADKEHFALFSVAISIIFIGILSCLHVSWIHIVVFLIALNITMSMTYFSCRKFFLTRKYVKRW